MEYLPNCLSVLRMILASSLLFISPFQFIFWLIYGLCGFSDMLDGFLARKLQVTSEKGAVFDTIGDGVMIAVVSVVVLSHVNVPFWALILIALIAGIRIVSLFVGWFRFHCFATIHTYGNKLAGFLAFCLLPFLWIDFGDFVILFCVSISLLAAIEELVLQLLVKKVTRNRKSLFLKE